MIHLLDLKKIQLKNDEEAFEILCKIVQANELKFKANQISYPISNTTINVPMICFTDTPIEQSFEHCLKYNYFGVSFNKTELIKYGANPVLYLVQNRIYHQEFIEHLRFDKNKDINLISFFCSILQPYNSKNIEEQNSAEFYEREWRITRVLPIPSQKLAIKYQGPINENKFNGRIRREQTDKNYNYYLPFKSNMIENIIVPIQYEEMGLKLIADNKLKCDLFVIKR